ncbi:MAG: Uma2 family endonuclease [Saprospiraceae bacterium]|nr:Uma2 family endonuclease [Saprospiraceae bacterium]
MILQKKKIAPIVPDFIMELRLPSDNLQPIKDKIAEFMECGCQLAWLIDPVLQQTTIYKADSNEEIVSFDKMLTGGDVLPEFEVKLSELLE